MNAYLARAALFLLLFLLCVGAFNWWSDPYGIWGPVDVERLNRNQQVFFLRLSKPWQVARIKPTAAIIGSSRSGSIDPQHPAWAAEVPYNLSLHGLTVYEMQRFVEHAIAQGTLDKLLIAIEYDTFLVAWPFTGVGYAEGRLLRPGEDRASWPRWTQRVRDLRDTLLTSSTLVMSLKANLGRTAHDRGMQGDGSWRLHSRKIGREGFVHSGKLMLERSRKKYRGIDQNLQILADILALCHRYNVDTRLYLSPEHLFMTDLRRQLGDGEARDAFIRRVVALNEDVAARAGSPPFPFWGFGHSGGIVDHPMPGGGETDAAWFRDGFHFYGRLGDIIMAQVWDDAGNRGFRLDSGSVDTYLDRVESLRARFVRDREQEVLAFRREILAKPD